MDKLSGKPRPPEIHYPKLILTVLPFILIILLISVVVWQLSIYNTAGGRGSYTVTTGWSHLDVVFLDMSPVYSYKSQNFTVVLINEGGVSVSLMNVSVLENISGVACTNVRVNGSDISGFMVPPNGEFRIDADCMRADKKENETYEILMDIDYDIFKGGVTTTHHESGRIKAYAE